MRKRLPLFLSFVAIAALAGASVMMVSLPMTYAVALLAATTLIWLILLRAVKPAWIVAGVLIIAPFMDILRATYFKNVPFMGVYQELVLAILLLSKLITSRAGGRAARFEVVDALVILLVAWNSLQVIQSPTIAGGLYVWRWYSIGPLTYLVFKFYSFTKQDYLLMMASICLGLAAAAAFIFYQYFILGPETVAQISQSLGFVAFYRNGWRLPGPFSSPLTASASYSILVLAGMALLFTKRVNWLGLVLIVLGGLAIVFTLSRSGIFIGLVGFTAVLAVNYQKIKNKIIPVLVGVSAVLLIAYQVPETSKFFPYLTNTNLDTYDTDRLSEFSFIFTEAVNRYPFGMGYAGGGAISLQALALFGSNQAYTPKFLGGDSVFFATLQTSGFIGLFLLLAIYVVMIQRSARVLFTPLTDSDRIIYLVAFSFFLGTFVTLGNLMDVWPLRLYLWSFGAMIMSYPAALTRSIPKKSPDTFPVNEPRLL